VNDGYFPVAAKSMLVGLFGFPAQHTQPGLFEV